VMALIDFVNEKLDEEDKKKGVLLCRVRRSIRRLWTLVIVKPTVWTIVGLFLGRKLLLSNIWVIENILDVICEIGDRYRKKLLQSNS
ncbi:MAG: hypothetical protein ACKPCM_10245, partial [Pseudanabaena sp.]